MVNVLRPVGFVRSCHLTIPRTLLALSQIDLGNDLGIYPNDLVLDAMEEMMKYRLEKSLFAFVFGCFLCLSHYVPALHISAQSQIVYMILILWYMY